MASFAITNESDNTVRLKKISLVVQPHQPMSSVKAYLVKGLEQDQIGSAATVPDQASTKEISFSKSSGLTLEPRGTAIINITAKPLFSAASGREGIQLKSVEIFGTLPFSIYGQDLSTSGGGAVPTSTSSGVLSAQINPSHPTTADIGTPGMFIGSFILSSSLAEPVKLTTLVFDKDESIGLKLKNLIVKVDGVQLGTTQAIVGDAESSLRFSGTTPFIIPVNGSVTIELFADISSSTVAGIYPSIFDLIGGNTIGRDSNAVVPFPASESNQISGMGLTIQGPRAVSSLSLSTSSDNVPAQYLTMGSTDQVVYKLKLRSTSGQEKIRITDIGFTDTIENNTAGIASLYNFRLYDGIDLIAGPVNMSLVSAASGKFSFSPSSPVVVDYNGRTLTVKADVGSYASGGAKSNSRHTIGISSSTDIIAFGDLTAGAATVSGTPSGTPQTIYRVKPGLTAAVIGSPAGRPRLAVDDVAYLTWRSVGASADDGLKISTVKIKFMGNRALASGNPPFAVSLLDPSRGANVDWGGSSQQTCTPVSGSCSVIFTPDASITGGSSKQVKLRISSGSFGNADAMQDTVSIVINAAADITWSDGTTNGIVWNAQEPGSSIPITIANISYE